MSKANARTGLASSDRLLSAGLGLAAASLGGLAWVLAGMWIDRSVGAGAAQHNAVTLAPFWALSAAGWVGLTLTWIALRRGAGAPRLRDRRATFIVLGVAVAARIVVLVTHEPALSDDVYRYIFDGRNLAQGINPYLNDPDDRAAAMSEGGEEHWVGERELVALLAYPEITTPYLPLSQYVFAGLARMTASGGWDSSQESARVFRIGFTVIEIMMLIALLRAMRARHLSSWWLTLYAWHPLAIDGIAASGHQDIIGIALMVGALALLISPAEQLRGGPGGVRVVVASVLLAMAIMVKPIAALAGLFAMRGRSWRDWLLMAGICPLVCITIALPLGWQPTEPAFVAWKQTADWMAEKAAHFGGVYEPVLFTVRHAIPDGPDREPGFNLEQEWLARRICMGVLISALVLIVIFVRDAWRASAAAMFALVLCSTTCHPWYLLWAFALFPVAPAGFALWIFSLTISFGYIVFIDGKGHALGVEWTTQPWALALTYIPVGIALVADCTARRRRKEPQAANL